MEDTGRENRCTRCGQSIDGDIAASTTSQAYCRQCTLDLADEIIADSTHREDKRKELIDGQIRTKAVRSKALRMIKWAMLCTAIAILLARLPVVTASFKKEKPLRYGTYETNHAADSCISTLWRISANVRAGEPIPSSYVCPLTGQPYRVQGQGRDLMVSCPNPQAHQLYILRVTARSPVPEVR